jgi:hypothetical protein
MARRYCTLLRAAQRPEPDMEAVFYNQVNGIRNQHRLIMAASRIDDSIEDFKQKTGLVSAYLDLA